MSAELANLRCYVFNSNSPDHQASECKATKGESCGKKNGWPCRAGDKLTMLSTSNFSKIADSLFPYLQIKIMEETQTTSTPKNTELQIEGVTT